MPVRLHPSFIRCAAWATFLLGAPTSAMYFWLGYYNNHWWAHDYMLSLLIPFIAAPPLVWFMFVPKRLEFTDSNFTIQFPFRKLHVLEWSDLKYYGPGPNVFMIQFISAGTFQISPDAFRRAEWRLLTNFLSATFPEREASGHFGDRMFRWPWKKT